MFRYKINLQSIARIASSNPAEASIFDCLQCWLCSGTSVEQTDHSSRLVLMCACDIECVWFIESGQMKEWSCTAIVISKFSLSFVFPHQNYINISTLPIYAKCHTHLILLHLISRTILGMQYGSWSSSVCSFLHSPATSSLLGPNNLKHPQPAFLP